MPLKRLQRLSSGAPTPTTPPEGSLPHLEGGGTDLLTMYQSQWATMHHMAVQNATAAEAVAGSISELCEECESQHSQLLELRSLLAHLPNIMAQLHSSLSTIGCVRNSLEEVETGLLDLEDTIEEAAAQEQILDMKMRVTIKRENRQHKYNMLHNELSHQHKERMAAVERAQEGCRRDRREAFTERFQDDLLEYKTKGCINKPSSAVPASSDLRLEDVSLLDCDNTQDLEDFLLEEEDDDAQTSTEKKPS
uniref:Dysbindin-like isoform X1 n=1 Tax=Hirondellea gigas TaxID=1518452 RepID=A0A6A7G1N9_9CRUS